MRKFAILAGIIAASILSTGPALADGPTTSGTLIPAPRPIGPGQSFHGLVNGAQSNAEIKLACRNTSRAGHPAPGQSVSVSRLVLPATLRAGFTGNASTIFASLHVPGLSTSATLLPPPIPLAVFAYYDQRVAIPTTLTLPCGGSGVVVFEPVQGGNTARAYRVAVKFVY